MTEKNVLTEIRENVIIATLNRPDALNALNDQLMDDLSLIVDEYEKNNVLTIESIKPITKPEF